MDPVRVKAYEAMRGYGQQGLAEQMRALNKPPTSAPEAVVENVEQADAPFNPESLEAADLESLLEQ